MKYVVTAMIPIKASVVVDAPSGQEALTKARHTITHVNAGFILGRTSPGYGNEWVVEEENLVANPRTIVMLDAEVKS